MIYSSLLNDFRCSYVVDVGPGGWEVDMEVKSQCKIFLVFIL